MNDTIVKKQLKSLYLWPVQIKSSLVEYMGNSGTAFLNYDNDILRNYHPRCKAYYYSLNDSKADIYADNIVISNNGTDFDIQWQRRVIKMSAAE